MDQTLQNCWDDQHAATLSEAELLLYRSNLLGADLRITNYGGGNTSAKLEQRDPLTGEPESVLWVKGSGGDLGSMGLDGFATLSMPKLTRLKELYREQEHEDEMVGYLPHCTFNLNPRAASIDTPLHAYIPHTHVDHMHPDAVIALACTVNSRELTEIVWGGDMGWLPWQRPGFDLGLKLEALARENPNMKGVLLEGHGLFTWGESSRACYENTLGAIQRATDWLAANNQEPAFGGAQYDQTLSTAERRIIAAKLMPVLRGKISNEQRKVGHFSDAPALLEFVNSRELEPLAALGTSCPDHFLRTKIRPLVIDFNPSEADSDAELARCLEGLDRQLDDYRAMYSAYYERCRREDSPPMRDPNAVVYLVPGVGMITFARDKSTARIAGEFYINAVNVMRDANGVSQYQGLPEQEAFDIEYWALEEAKLQRMPRPKPLAGRIVFITGGAGGIGKATAQRLAREGACVMLADIDEASLEEAIVALRNEFGDDSVSGTLCNVTDEAAVQAAFAESAVAFGGLDILVSNAGIASAAPLDETSMGLWNRNLNILATGYFLASREGFRLMKAQGIGGSVIFIGSKNGLVASANASAYCAAKAATLQLARSVALEGAPLDIRCNTVNPDGVLRGSKIWSGKWKEDRAAANGVKEADLEEHYRQRSLLKRSVFPADIAEGVYFFANEATSGKSTGNILNIDGGHAPSFTR